MQKNKETERELKGSGILAASDKARQYSEQIFPVPLPIRPPLKQR